MRNSTQSPFASVGLTAKALVCLSLLFVGFTVSTSPTFAASPVTKVAPQGRSLDGAKQFIAEIAQKSVIALQENDQTSEQRQQNFEKLWNDGFAFDTIGRFVLGRYWRQATPEQRTRYQELFVASVMRTSVNVLGSLKEERIRITDARLAGKKDMLVSTRIIRPKGPAIPVDWRVRVIDGRYRIIDVTIEGVSMALTKRSEYSAVVKNRGLEGLLTALQSNI